MPTRRQLIAGALTTPLLKLLPAPAAEAAEPKPGDVIEILGPADGSDFQVDFKRGGVQQILDNGWSIFWYAEYFTMGPYQQANIHYASPVGSDLEYVMRRDRAVGYYHPVSFRTGVLAQAFVLAEAYHLPRPFSPEIFDRLDSGMV